MARSSSELINSPSYYFKTTIYTVGVGAQGTAYVKAPGVTPKTATAKNVANATAKFVGTYGMNHTHEAVCGYVSK